MRSTVFCNQCGSENSTTAVFCEKCGKHTASSASTKSSNPYFWALSLFPFFFWILAVVFSAIFDPRISTVITFISVWAINDGLVYADSKHLRNQGIAINARLGYYFVPGYLYKRAKITSSAQTGLLVWCGALVMGLLVSILGTNFIGAQVSTDATETAIKSWLVESFITDDSVTVTCPDYVLSKTGANFLCTVDTDPTTTIQVKVENEQGDVTWQILG